MAQRNEDFAVPSTSGEARRGRPRPEGDLSEDTELVLFQNVAHESNIFQSIPGEVGIIESIEVENFMGYSKLGPVRFGSNINFVVGHDGKSALLAALIIGLGGKSLGLSFRQFVKEGKTSANISITLRNIGENAFKSEVFGDSITVQQCICVDRNPSHQLKDQAGKLVVSEGDELKAILDHFKISIDNPVTVLHEDIGGQLLQIIDDADRYRLFLEATELEQMREEYLEILEKKARNQQKVEEGKEQLERLSCEVTLVESRYQNLVSMKEKLENLKREMAWAIVNETEKAINEKISNISAGEQHIIVLRQELELSKSRLNEAENRLKAIIKNLEKLNDDYNGLQQEYTEAKENAKKIDMAYTQMASLYNSSQNELYKLENVAKQLHDKIENLKTSLELAELEKQKNVSTLTQRLKTLREQECSLVQDIKLLHGTIEKDDEEHFRLKKEESHVQELLHEEQNQLRHWKECKSEPMKRFGPQISALVEAVDNAHRQGHFTHKPLGPLGACIRLRDPKFALAIECCLRGLLLHFFCDNHNDELILQGLMKNIYPSGSPGPQIIVSAFDCELYDVTGRAADHPEFPTVLKALEIPDAVVANTLIDMKGIQSVLLVKSNSVAHAVMQGEAFPKNCQKILTTCGDEVFDGWYSICEESRPTYLGDMDIEINNLEQEVENKTAQLSAFHQHINLLENDLKKNRETIDSHYKDLNEMTVKRIDITSEIKDLENQNEKQSKEISGLESVAQEIKESIKEVEKRIQSRKSEMEDLRQVKINSEEKLKDFESKFNQISNLSESFMEERNDAGSEVSIRYNSMKRCTTRLEQQLYYIQNIKEELDMKKRELQRETPMAKYLCPKRMECTRMASVLYEEINMLKETIKSETSTHGIQEEIRNQYLKGTKCQEELSLPNGDPQGVQMAGDISAHLFQAGERPPNSTPPSTGPRRTYLKTPRSPSSKGALPPASSERIPRDLQPMKLGCQRRKKSGWKPGLQAWICVFLLLVTHAQEPGTGTGGGLGSSPGSSHPSDIHSWPLESSASHRLRDLAPAWATLGLWQQGPSLVIDAREAEQCRLGEKASSPGGHNHTDLPNVGKIFTPSRRAPASSQGELNLEKVDPPRLSASQGGPFAQQQIPTSILLTTCTFSPISEGPTLSQYTTTKQFLMPPASSRLCHHYHVGHEQDTSLPSLDREFSEGRKQ
ncbi:structural maintenance of chromosomes protein 6-like [Sarcophilus harrisii]